MKAHPEGYVGGADLRNAKSECMKLDTIHLDIILRVIKLFPTEGTI
jgi:hypothetical protein